MGLAAGGREAEGGGGGFHVGPDGLQFNYQRLAQEVLYLVSLLVCLALIDLGLRRVRLVSLQAEKAGWITPELEEALADNVPIVFSGIATLLLPVMAYLAVFKPV